ncbi:DUF2809 domain-containing protein [Kineosporia sp. A_224]|uniref:ribosomal maturation YjgA family protein n=1 Tax=Kineosporia sp. A_224 TaxID=1962180 RepID=UPI001179A2C6|nr:DUF2809 domain-containing protein [Kineosporia sp. A_224]
MIATGHEADGGAAARRPWLHLAVVVVLGLAVHGAGSGWVGDKAGDALYAAMVYLLVVVLWPRRPGWLALVAALSWCLAVELLQLSDLPRAAADVFPLSALVLGAGFDAWDLVAYVIGATGVAVVRGLGDRSRPRRSATSS